MHPASDRRERIMAMGGYGAGKTSAWLNIAKWSQLKGSPAKFYTIDTDGSLDAMLDGPPYDILTNVVKYDAFTYSEMLQAEKDISNKVTHDDWTVVDIISFLWEAVQTEYIDKIFASDIGEFFLEARIAKKGGNALDGWKDWSVMNKMNKEFINLYVHRTPGHKFMTATAEPLRDSDSREIRALFGPHGVRPGGQKHLGNLPHTILLMKALKSDEIYMTTVKDRQRDAVVGKQVGEFALDYLVNIAGWSL